MSKARDLADGKFSRAIRSDISSATENFIGATSGGGRFSIEPDDYSAANPVWKLRSYSNENIAVVIGGVERARFRSSGGLTFNGDTAAANALDDYEEGTFDLIMYGSVSSGPSPQITIPGTYTKIGNLVTVHCETSGSINTSSYSGYVYFGGLPFTVGTGGVGSIMSYNGLTYNSTDYGGIVTYFSSGSDQIYVYTNSSATYWRVTYHNPNSTVYFKLTGYYFV